MRRPKRAKLLPGDRLFARLLYKLTFCRSADEIVWQQRFSAVELAFLQGHRVGNVMLLPGTCYIEMARAVVRQQHGAVSFALPNVRFQTIMFLDEAAWRGAPIVRLQLDTDSALITITSRLEDGAWDTHAYLGLELQPGGAGAAPLDPTDVRTRCPEHVTGDTFYASTGNAYSGEFRALTEAWGGGGVGFGSVSLPLSRATGDENRRQRRGDRFRPSEYGHARRGVRWWLITETGATAPLCAGPMVGARARLPRGPAASCDASDGDLWGVI